jgi:hypothetical protein
VTVTDVAAERLVTVVARIDALDPLVTWEVGLPTDPTWMALPELLAEVPAWHGDLTARVGDRRTAAAYLAVWIAEVPALLLGLPVVFGGPSIDLEAEDLHVRRHADGWFDGLALDPWSVAGAGDRVGATGVTIRRLTTPLVDALADALPVGRAAIWGGVADGLCGRALHVARELRVDAEQVWAASSGILDVLGERLVPPLVRPQPLDVPWSGGLARYLTRGTCCLHHRTCDDPDPRGEGYCATCPLRPAESRVERLAAHLERTSPT